MKRGLLAMAAVLVLLAGATLVVSAEDEVVSATADAPQSYAAAPGGCCGGAAEGWLIEALAGVDQDELKAALGKLDNDPEAKSLLASKEGVTLRKIIETGRLPDLSLEEYRKLEQSPRTLRLLRALYGLVRVQGILKT